MTVRDQEIKEYCLQIKRHLPGSAKTKKRIMDSIHRSIANYLQEHPQADMESLKSHMGAPEQIADAYVEQLDVSEVVKQFDFKKTVIGIICGAVALALLLWAMTVAIAFIDNKKSENTYIETFITEG